MYRLLTLRSEPREIVYEGEVRRAGVALEIDFTMPQFFGVGIVSHACDICAYVQVMILGLGFCFKVFIEPLDDPMAGLWPAPTDDEE